MTLHKFFHCQNPLLQHPLPSSVDSCNDPGHSHHTKDIVSSFGCSCFKPFFLCKSLIRKAVGEEVIGRPSLLRSAVFFRDIRNKINSLDKSFLTWHGVKYKNLIQASSIYIQLHPLWFVRLKLERRLRYSWLSMPVWGMQTHMNLHDSILVKGNWFQILYISGFNCQIEKTRKLV